MSSTEFGIIVGVIVALIALPLMVILIVNRIVPVDAPVIEEATAEDPTAFESVGDFWSGLLPHLRELRDRVVWAAVSLGITTAISFYLVTVPSVFGKTLPSFLVDHFVPDGVQLQFVGAAEGFVTNMRLALVIGVALAMPVVVFQLVAFFVPGMLPHEKRILFIALPFVTELFIAGLVFGWFFTVPSAMTFLLTFGQAERIRVQPSFESFMELVSTLMLWNGVIFEMPAVIYVLARLGVVSAAWLASTRRYAIVIITIVAAIITPTGDPYNLMLLAVPMYLLYELGILLSRFVPKNTTRSIPR